MQIVIKGEVWPVSERKNSRRSYGPWKSERTTELWLVTVDLGQAERKKLALMWIYAISLNNVHSQMSNKQWAHATASISWNEIKWVSCFYLPFYFHTVENYFPVTSVLLSKMWLKFPSQFKIMTGDGQNQTFEQLYTYCFAHTHAYSMIKEAIFPYKNNLKINVTLLFWQPFGALEGQILLINNISYRKI